jgi:hypothetical protein
VRLREALQLSLNMPVVALTEALGPARLMAALRRAGVEAEVPGGAPGLAVALGGVGVSLEGIVQLYACRRRNFPSDLQRFGGRDPGFEAFEVAFPPDGAVVEAEGLLMVRVRGGTGPFTWLADGRPFVMQGI